LLQAGHSCGRSAECVLECLARADGSENLFLHPGSATEPQRSKFSDGKPLCWKCKRAAGPEREGVPDASQAYGRVSAWISMCRERWLAAANFCGARLVSRSSGRGQPRRKGMGWGGSGAAGTTFWQTEHSCGRTPECVRLRVRGRCRCQCHPRWLATAAAWRPPAFARHALTAGRAPAHKKRTWRSRAARGARGLLEPGHYLWRARWVVAANRLWHVGHSKGFSPVCRRMCVESVEWSANAIPHCSHL